VNTFRRLNWLFLSPLFLVVILHGQTPALPLHSGSVRFAAIGDMGTGEQAQYEVAAQMSDLHRSKFPFDFVIMLGDNIYGGNTAADYQRRFESPYKDILDAGVRFYAALGNHDNAVTQRAYKPFNMNGQQYYTYRKGNAQFFALDSNYMDPKQLSWLSQELQKSDAPWKICYFHHPLYSSAKFHGPSLELRRTLEPLFIQYGVQVVFSGHDHVYERLKPQKGIYYFVEGASGELRRGDLRKTTDTAAGYDQDQSFMLVEISGDDLDFRAVSRRGMTIDYGLIQRPKK
jgi:predicted MPP superfamily phosphohydrolase